MISNKDHILIDHYIQGVLSFREAEQVEHRLIHEEDLNVFYNQQLLLIEGIKRSGRNNTIKFLKDLENTLPVIKIENGKSADSLEKGEIKKLNWFYISTAIAAVFIIGLFLLLPFQSSNEEIFADNFKPYPNVLSSNVRGEQALTEDALYYYDLGNYIKSIELFTAKSTLSYQDKFYLANSYLAEGEVDQAISLLQEAKTNLPDFKEQSTWFLALAYLKADDLEKAKTELKLLSSSEGSYQQKAETLLNTITN